MDLPDEEVVNFEADGYARSSSGWVAVLSVLCLNASLKGYCKADKMNRSLPSISG